MRISGAIQVLEELLAGPNDSKQNSIEEETKLLDSRK